MSKLIDQCEILNVHTQKRELASIYECFSDTPLQDFMKLWKPTFIKKENLIRTNFSDENGTIDADGYSKQIEHYRMQDWNWDWIKYNEKAIKYDSYKIYAVVCDGKLQGLMRTITVGYKCRLSSQKGKAVVYVDRIAIAPWNRSPWFDPRQYKYVGEVLIATGISLSIEVGFKGRICLHSLPQADSWYVGEIGMTNCGSDPDYQDLNWYEMIPKNSKKFLSNSVASEVSV